ncbi:MAG: DUF882 domain-containing protein [Polyangiales bacterium]
MNARLVLGALALWAGVSHANPLILPTFPPPTGLSTGGASKKSSGPNRPLRLRIPVGTLINVHLGEAVVLDPVPGPLERALLRRALRDRANWEERDIDPRPLQVLRSALVAFGARRVEVISAYRSDKLNEMLRKKGRHVARQSQHVLGRAVDFRIVGVPTRDLLRYVRTIHRGGVGFYPSSGFVHVDSGRDRQWRGE